MEQGSTGGGIDDALNMLEAFGSVGVQFVSITHTDIHQQRRGFRPKESLAEAKASMKFLVPASFRRQNNVILRPHRPPAVLLIQLDDLGAEALERVRPLAFLLLETSPGNFQGWVAVNGPRSPEDAPFARRVRKAAGADPTASGAARMAGTANYKLKYQPDFPTVAIRGLQPGRITTKAELEEQGLVAPAEPIREARLDGVTTSRGRSRVRWPSYEYCLARAPKAHGADKPDVSRADFAWCVTAIDWGWSVEDVASRLMEVSPKAQESGERYALLTATNAAAAVQHRGRVAERSP